MRLEDILKSAARIDALRAEAEKIAFNAKAADRKARDDMDAAYVESIRELGRKIGQEKEYNKRAARILKERGY
ncbi:hypothetical protein [Microtetraspora malaysiensis]|uniref:hypothetical protein n=1 Tax=Microtetraspora malaysiensis TaxID=161358 RepID=UPI003D8BEDDF